jgi:hypothetical protein
MFIMATMGRQQPCRRRSFTPDFNVLLLLRRIVVIGGLGALNRPGAP